jgi:NAD(P)-dependent dehydrogenase (short-subunit alcohol dehydrogenase family)
VVVSGRHDDKGQDLVTELRALGAEAEFVRADVQKEDDVRDLVDKTVQRFGRLDVAVNNAGLEGELGVIQDATVENFRAVHDRNVVGVFLSMKHELRAMAGQDSGSIVNIASTYGHKAAAGATAYVSSKFAVEGLTKTVALEQGNSGIRVNAVGPGPIDTGMLDRFTGTEEGNDALIATVPMRRRGKAEENCQRHRVPFVPRSVLHFWHGVRSRRRHVGNLINAPRQNCPPRAGLAQESRL